jgi:nitronate monooxygenase
MDEAALARFRTAVEAGDFDVAHVYAGQGVAALTREGSAADVLAEFARVL